MSTASRIVGLRERSDLTQKELSARLGINRSVLNRIEKGTRPIRDDEVKLIADFFGVSTDYLLGNDGKDITPAFNDDEISLVLNYRALDTVKRQTLINMLAFLNSPQASGSMIIQSNIGNNNSLKVGNNSPIAVGR